jgi:hypothetical protein
MREREQFAMVGMLSHHSICREQFAVVKLLSHYSINRGSWLLLSGCCHITVSIENCLRYWKCVHNILWTQDRDLLFVSVGWTWILHSRGNCCRKMWKQSCLVPVSCSNEWMNVWGVGHNNTALAPRPSMIYCALLINPLLILHFEWNQLRHA